MNEQKDLPLWFWICLGIFLLIQGNLLFRDARKRGRKAWFWGLWGITGTPTPVICYLLFVVWLDRRRARKLKTERNETKGGERE
ncbi:hypothetical protein [Paenibacillus sp. NFR01]|uniref:hypothetical protein n=1 Tax=Paenibacillus sp. NFR01 TaxID=1566279 RepID=UPI0008B3B4CD|nr:hypothetical protein [Paenibacillus sp. NFR01]SEU25201.1 hypothetical protein SAMN03159358_4349 [Paenibacillus sp. NFR01]